MLEQVEEERSVTATNAGSDPVLDAAIDRAVAHLRDTRQPGGYWWGGLEGSCAPAAAYILLTSFLGVDDPRREPVARYILSQQRADGSWSRYPGGPGDLSLTVECYLALRLVGAEPRTAAPLEAARGFVLAQGGAARSGLLTRVWLALFGQVPWSTIPAIPPELLFLPRWFPFNPQDFPGWTRATFVPLTIVWAKRCVAPLPQAAVDELFADPADRRHLDLSPAPILSWRGFFLRFDRLFRRLEALPLKAWRPGAVGRAERWLREHQEADGAWAGAFAATTWSLVALGCLEKPPDDPAVARGLAALREEFPLETPDGLTFQPVLQPVSDTALALSALRAAGVPGDDPALLQAGRWLLEAQSFVEGDWRADSPGTDPGGWPASFAPDHYPDVDVTGRVMFALLSLQLPEEEARPVLERGLRWLIGMQSPGGGWASADRRGGRRALADFPFLELAGPVGRASADCTAGVVEMLVRGGRGREFDPVARALSFLVQSQEPDGSWPGDRGVNHIFGTARVAAALAASGGPGAEARLARAARWLEGHQSADGAWGETADSYTDPTLRGLGPATPTQTAWGLLGLVAAGEAAGAAARRAAEWLVRTQCADGSWEEQAFTARTPGGAPARSRLWRTCYPLLALARYREAAAGSMPASPLHSSP